MIIASSHVQNPAQASIQPRPRPTSKPSGIRSLNQARLSKNAFIQPPMPSMPVASNGNEAQIVEQFRLYRMKADRDALGDNSDEHDASRHRLSYTREHKLAAISYAQTTWKTQKDGGLKLIRKYAAAKDLGITTAMLRQWIKNKLDSEGQSRGKRKDRKAISLCQEPELQERLLGLFTKARDAGRKITNNT